VALPTNRHAAFRQNEVARRRPAEQRLRPSAVLELRRYRAVAVLVLKYAGASLQPGDAARIAATVDSERARVRTNPLPETFISPAYAVILAQRKPDNASEILYREIAFETGMWSGAARGELAAALRRFRCAEEREWLHDFFSNEPISPIGPLVQMALIDSLETKVARSFATFSTIRACPRSAMS
jgi:hypothetical protein